jgi:hypothetical protein
VEDSLEEWRWGDIFFGGCQTGSFMQELSVTEKADWLYPL